MPLPEQLAELRAVDPHEPAGAAALRAVLRRKTGVLIGAAADRVRLAVAPGFEADLVRAFETLCERGLQRDPGCSGKFAVISALHELDWHDPAVFLTGARLRQMEPSWGPPVDSAVGVRSQSAFALVRLSHPDTPGLLADLLADPIPSVRANAARAVAAWADPMGAALLRLKLHHGDEDPGVLCDVLAAMVALDPDGGLTWAKGWLDGRDADRREVAALALGQTRLADAVPILLDAADSAVDPEERRMVLVALGTMRIEAARDALLERLEGPDVDVVIEALRPFRFDPRTLELALERAPALAVAVQEALVDR